MRHSGSVSSSLIGGRGVYAICPSDHFVWGGSYEPGSLIWQPADAQQAHLLRGAEGRRS